MRLLCVRNSQLVVVACYPHMQSELFVNLSHTMKDNLMKTYNTLSETISALKSRGYNQDFNLHPEWIECPPMNLKLKPAEFHVDEVHRFEGMTNPDDSAVLYAISST